MATAAGSEVSGEVVGQIFLAGEEPHKGAAPMRVVITDRAAEHREPGLERVEDRSLGDRVL